MLNGWNNTLGSIGLHVTFVLVIALAAACSDSDDGPGDPADCDPTTDPACSTTDGGSAGDGGADAGGLDGSSTDAGGDGITPDGGGGDTTVGDGGGGDDGGGSDLPAGADSDGDGIPDDVEGNGDADGDGTPNYLDDDSDNDGIPDSDEIAEDTDGDGVPDFLDSDSDGDGFADGEEGDDDPDGDGIPNFRDTDSDGDSLPDDFEGAGDGDGDGIVDFLDTDSDGDGIPDFQEGGNDPDEDGIPNFLDLDSDGDGHSDADEYGQIPGSGLPPVDRDSDRIFDFLDPDSDGDGLADADELGCPESTERTLWDSDDDGYSDLLEVAFGDDPEDAGQACDGDETIEDDVDFFFQLPYLDDTVEGDELDFNTDVRRGDIAFNMDTTGSMFGEISILQGSLTDIIIPGLEARLADVAYAFTQFDDFPCNSYGGGADRPLILRQRVTTDAAATVAGVLALERHGGGDYYESGFEALYQIATGFGRDNPACIPGVEVEPFDAAHGYVEDVADGEIGGVGFREGSVPIIVHMTDAPSHAKGEDSYPYGATRVETFTVMLAIGAKMIGVASGSDARSDLEEMTASQGSVVPTCAWDGFRPLGCAAGQCCTGAGGSGRPPTADGLCPLVYDINSSGTGLDASIIDGIEVLVNFATFDLTTRVRMDEEEFDATGIDTSCFITSVVPIRAEAPDTGCATVPEIADLNGDGVDEHFINVTPGSRLTFFVNPYNPCVEPTDSPQVFTAFIDVVGQGAAVLDTRVVTVLVPPDVKL